MIWTCPVCGCEEIEKAKFFNGKSGLHKRQTAIGYFCTSCPHATVELVISNSIKAILEADEEASLKFRKIFQGV